MFSSFTARHWRRWHHILPAAVVLATTAVVYVTAATAASPAAADQHNTAHSMSQSDRVTAMLATAAFQDVTLAEQAGYASSLQTLGCFQSPGKGGMGVHYIKADLMDGHVDITTPEALVYELDAAGHIAGLVAHEYIVQV